MIYLIIGGWMFFVLSVAIVVEMAGELGWKCVVGALGLVIWAVVAGIFTGMGLCQ